jgi:hypothetical protein
MDWLSTIANIAQVFSAVWVLAFGSYALHEVLSNAGRLPTWFKNLNLPKIKISNFFFITVIILLIAILIRIMTWSPLNDLFNISDAKGVDLESYCNSLQYSENSDNEFCSSKIDLNLVCDWEYQGSNYTFKFDNEKDLYTAICYDPQGNRKQGIHDMTGYCNVTHEGGVSEGIVVNKTWVCRMKINMTIACIWQYGILNMQARENDQTWACYKD